MAYQVLARKYRPQSFEDIIGQAHVATTLTNALRQQKVAHAYLFAGPRGVGKTTTARILAKALNCSKGPTSTPCNQCDSCLRIAQGQEMVDVLEIDAASNRGIEEIRELRENVRYAPARSRYKVYIVDEAHQITHDAFNAFLKTLEEPPEHAVFILATTEHQKIPATILSRCQLFRFRRVSADDITAQMEKILAQEKLSVEKQALLRLARASGGSVRDALSLLDQALAYTSGPLKSQQVEMLLGFLPEEFLQGFAGAILSREPTQVLQWVKKLSDEGWEIPQFVRDFREYLRLQMVEQLGGGAKPEALKIGDRTISLGALLQTIKVLGQCLDEMRWNDNPQLVLELYALRLTQPFMNAGDLLKRLEALEKTGPVRESAPAPSPSKPPISVVPVPARVAPSIKPVAAAPTPAPVPPTLERSVPSSAAAPVGSVSKEEAAAQWKRLLSELWKKPAVASHMERAYLKSATNTEWVVSFPDKFAMDSVQRSSGFILETLAALCGRAVQIRFIYEARETRETSPMIIAAPEAEEKLATVSQDANVQKVLQMFKGKIRLSEESES